MVSKRTPITIVLPDIRSAMNVGAIFRTADAILADKIYLTGYTATPEHPKVAKTSLGAEATVRWEYKKDTKELLTELKKSDLKVYGLEITDNSRCIWNVDFKFPAALVVGNEIHGISNELLELCDEVIHLPMLGQKESLNVATATGIALYRLLEGYTCNN